MTVRALAILQHESLRECRFRGRFVALFALQRAMFTLELELCECMIETNRRTGRPGCRIVARRALFARELRAMRRSVARFAIPKLFRRKVDRPTLPGLHECMTFHARHADMFSGQGESCT